MTTMDINEIMQLLPHRYPFLLVDRVTSFEPKTSLTAYKNITLNEPYFQGHFPEQPVMPGVLIMEALAQAGCILAFLSLGVEEQGHLAYIMGMDNVKFRQRVVPGDRLDLNVEILRFGSKYWKLRGEAFVDGKKVAEGEMLAAHNVG